MSQDVNAQRLDIVTTATFRSLYKNAYKSASYTISGLDTEDPQITCSYDSMTLSEKPERVEYFMRMINYRIIEREKSGAKCVKKFPHVETMDSIIRVANMPNVALNVDNRDGREAVGIDGDLREYIHLKECVEKVTTPEQRGEESLSFAHEISIKRYYCNRDHGK